MRNKRLIGKLNLVAVYVVSVLVILTGISFAMFNNNDTFMADMNDYPTMTLRINGNYFYSTSNSIEVVRTMRPMSNEEARVGETIAFSTTRSTSLLNMLKNEFRIEVNTKNNSLKTMYVGISTSYLNSGSFSKYAGVNFHDRRIRDNFVKFDISTYDMKSNKYEKIADGVSFDNLDNTMIGFIALEPGESIDKLFIVNCWISDEVTICDDGTCSYTSSQFNKISSNLDFNVSEFEILPNSETNTTTFFNSNFKTRYTSQYPSNTEIDMVEEIDFKRMPKENILNRYNNADFKVMIDSNTYSWLEVLEDGAFYKCIVASDKKMIPSSNLVSQYVFRGFDHLSLIDFGKNVLDTSEVTKFEGIFYQCYRLQYIKGFKYLDFSSCTSFRELFLDCYSLVHIDFGKIDNLLDTYKMFSGCTSLSILDLRTIDLSKITNASYMFNACINLVQIYSNTSLTCSSTDTFTNALALRGSIPYDTSKKSSTYGNITSTGYFIKPYTWDTSTFATVSTNKSFWTYLKSQYHENQIKTLIITSVDDFESFMNATKPSNITGVSDTNIGLRAWYDKNDATTVYVINTSEYPLLVKNADIRINEFPNLEHFAAYGVVFDSLEEEFYNMSNLKAVDLAYTDTGGTTSYKKAFFGMNGTINTYDLNTNIATDFTDMFASRRLSDYVGNGSGVAVDEYKGSNLYLNLSSLVTNSLTSLSGIFKDVQVTNFNYTRYAVERYNGINAYNVTDASFMYNEHHAFYDNLVIPDIGLYNVKNFSSMFYEVSQVDLPRQVKLDTTNIKYLSNEPISFDGMFLGTMFDIIDISGFNTSSISSKPLKFDEVFGLACIKLIAKHCNFTGLTSPFDSEYMKLKYLLPLSNSMSDEELMFDIMDTIISMDMDSDKIKILYNTDNKGTFIIPYQSIIDYIEYIDLSSSKFSNSIAGLFYGYSNLSYLNLSNVDTSQVTDMSCLVFGDIDLLNIDFSSFKYNNCKSLSGMLAFTFPIFVNMNNLNTTTKLTDLSYLFLLYICQSEGLNLAEMNTSKVEDMSFMFAQSTCFEMLDFIHNCDTSNVKFFTGMFAYLSGLVDFLDLTNFDTRNGLNFDYMFINSDGLTEIDVGVNFVNNSNTVPIDPFVGCDELVGYCLETDGSESYRDYEDMEIDLFHVCTQDQVGMFTLKGAMLLNFNTLYTNMPSSPVFTALHQNVTKIVFDIIPEEELYQYDVYEYVDINNDIRATVDDNVLYILGSEYVGNKFYLPPDSSNFFANLPSVTEIEGLELVSPLFTVNLSHFFENCASLTDIDISSWDAPLVTDMSYFLNGCGSLKHARFGNFDAPNVTTLDYAFKNCVSLIAADISGMSTHHLTSINEMFRDDSELIYVFAGDGWDISNVPVTNSNTLYGCSKLTGMSYNGDFTDVNYSGTYASSDGARITNDVGGFFSDKINYMMKFSSIENCDITFSTIVNFKWSTAVPSSGYYDISVLGDGGILIWRDGNDLCIYSKEQCYYPLNCYNLFNGWTNLETLPTGPKFTYTYNMNSMLSQTHFKGTIDFDTRNCRMMTFLFSETKLTGAVNLSALDISRVSSLNFLLAFCKDVTSVDLSGWKLDHNISFDHIFQECESLTSIVVGLDWDNSYITTAVGALEGVSASFKGKASNSSTSYQYTPGQLRAELGLTIVSGFSYEDKDLLRICTKSSHGALTATVVLDGVDLN